MRKLLLLTICASMTSALIAQQIPKLTIDSVQWVSQTSLGNCDDESRYDGDTVEISGICLVSGSDYGSSSHNIQVAMSGTMQPFGAIRFRQGDPNASYLESIRNLVAGDSIVAKGVLSQYQGETQFEPLETNDAIKVLKQGVSVKPIALSVGVFNDNQRNNNLSTGEQWESSFVTLKNLTVVSVDPFSGNRVSFTVADQQGNRINVGDHFFAQKTPQYTHPVTNQAGSFVAPNVGDQLDSIQGIIIHSKNNCPNANGRGYEIHPFKASHYVYGQTAPSISGVKRNHQVPSSSQSVTIEADIVSKSSTVSVADLYWQKGTNLNNTTFNKVSMSLKSGNTYEATIPAQTDGSFIRYYIYAEDANTLSTQMPSNDPKQSTYAYVVRNGGLTIYDVNYTPYADGSSIFNNEEVTITGVVTATANDNQDLGLIHMQEEWSLSPAYKAIEVTNTGALNLKRGDKITVTGTISERFGKTRISSASTPTKSGTGNVEPFYLPPDTLASHTTRRVDLYESVLIGLVNNSGVGNNKIHVVNTNADGPNNNFGEYLVGRDPQDPNNGARVLAGRDGFSSLWVSFIQEASSTAPTLRVPKVQVSDTMNMDTLVGICEYSFSSFKMLPRNNADFIGINYGKVIDTNTSIVEQRAGSLLSFYPNPSDQVLILNNLSTDKLDVKITDMQGRVHFIEELVGSREIGTGQLQSGLYLISVSNSKGELIQREKLIIQH